LQVLGSQLYRHLLHRPHYCLRQHWTEFSSAYEDQETSK
jgi:hypothetical protein